MGQASESGMGDDAISRNPQKSIWQRKTGRFSSSSDENGGIREEIANRSEEAMDELAPLPILATGVMANPTRP